ncbi:endonuclease/exonuclease/phosphatase family protein [Streptomyces sp. NPDC059070]|uniref:endonuclease/exonuclease/phosphatase family protein n=1 Tax=unclassified Streptomyces TaxID=2593676 RepID=UPI0034E2F7FC
MTRFHARPALALALLLLPLATAQPSAAAAPRTLTVLTYNIHHGAGADDSLDLDRAARVLRDSGADVIGLQEVDRHYSSRSDFADQAGWLAQRLGMHMVYGANLSLDPARRGDPRRQYGTAILTRFPVRESHNTLLPRPHQGEQRGLLEADIDVGGESVRVLNTHLEHTSQDERIAQADAIGDVVDGSDSPTVLVGDLNATPGTREVAVLTRRLGDAWRAAGEGAGYTFDVRDPRKRIDYVLVSPGVSTRRAEVLDTDASDHLPVSAEVSLP